MLNAIALDSAGYEGITESQCNAKGCCYEQSNFEVGTSSAHGCQHVHE